MPLSYLRIGWTDWADVWFVLSDPLARLFATKSGMGPGAGKNVPAAGIKGRNRRNRSFLARIGVGVAAPGPFTRSQNHNRSRLTFSLAGATAIRNFPGSVPLLPRSQLPFDRPSTLVLATICFRFTYPLRNLNVISTLCLNS